jgi:hypothetical protein
MPACEKSKMTESNFSTCRENVKAPLLKLFEFLVASICLFVIDDDEPPPPPHDDVFSLAVPAATGATGRRSAQTPCWWSVNVQRPGLQCKDAGAMLRTYEILCVVISVQAPQAWKIVQLSLLTLWNVCVRRRGAETYVVEKGIAIPLLDICVQQHWPPSVRMMAAGFLASLAESADNIAQLGGILPMIAANVKLLRSQVFLSHFITPIKATKYIYALLFTPNFFITLAVDTGAIASMSPAHLHFYYVMHAAPAPHNLHVRSNWQLCPHVFQRLTHSGRMVGS